MIDDPLNRLKVKRGEELPQSKLTDDDVKMIKQIIEDRDAIKARLKGMTNAALAEKFDVHQRTVEKIVQGFTWSHIW